MASQKTSVFHLNSHTSAWIYPVLLILALLALQSFPLAAQGSAIFVVNDLGDASDIAPGDGLCNTASGVCTLRAAIQEANSYPNGTEPDRIHFNLPISTTHRYEIDRSDIMPPITDPVVIDGTTQPDYVDRPVIVLDGILRQESGLVISAGNSTIRGLSIIYFREYGIHLTTNGGNTIQGNYIGTDATTDKGVTKDGIRIENSPNNLIGGTGSGDGNVISGNAYNTSGSGGQANIYITGSASQNTIIRGNIIGLRPDGLAMFTNSAGIVISEGTGTVIGGVTPSARNVIGFDHSGGIRLFSGAAVNTVIQGNYIGTDISGSRLFGTNGNGIEVTGATSGLIIGGATGTTPGGPCTGACNLIAANSDVVDIGSLEAENITIQGNYINANADGVSKLYNNGPTTGMTLNIRNSLIGGTQPGAGNLVVGARRDGIQLSGTNIDVIGNFIGTNSQGTDALSNGGTGLSLAFAGTSNIRIRQNVLSGNNGRGLVIGHGVTDVVVTGNWIGTDVTGTQPIGNDFEGVYILSSANDITIGGTSPSDGNILAHNLAGIRTSQEIASLRILGNSIFSNIGQGIQDENMPPPGYRIDDVRLDNGTLIEGEFSHLPSTAYRLEYFANSSCDGSGSGEGEEFLISTSVATDANGIATFSVSSPVEVATTDWITITATSDNGAGRTTAFSRCAAVYEADLAIEKTVDQPTHNEGDTYTYTISVSNTGPDAASNIQIMDMLPEQVAYISDDSNGAYNSDTGLWAIDSLAPQANRTLTITVSLLENLLGTTFDNTATITSLDQHDPYLQNQNASVGVQVGADLQVNQSADNTYPLQGSEVNLVVTLRNNGPGAAANVVVQDMLPVGLQYVSHSTSSGTYSETNSSWSMSVLPADEEATLSLVAAVDSRIPNQVIINTASVTQSDFDDPNMDNNTAKVSLAVGGTDLSITSTISNDNPDENDIIQITLTASNLGVNPVDGVVVQDTLPAGLVFVSANASKGAYADTLGLWTIGQLAGGETTTLTISARVAEGLDGATLQNSASIDTPQAPDLNAVNDVSQTIITVRLPFVCEKLRLYEPYMTDVRMHALFFNGNPQTTTITGSHVVWNAPDLVTSSGVQVRYQTFGNVPFWFGPDTDSPTNTFTEGDFRDAVAVMPGSEYRYWSTLFNVPVDLANYSTVWDFAGTILYVDHPQQEADCAVMLELPEQQAVFNVNTTADVNDGVCNPAHCSLREALVAARAVSGSIVNIPAGTYIRTLTNTADFNLTGIGTINGAGPEETIIDANGRGSVFHVHGGQTVVKNLTMQGGVSSKGGGIYNELNGNLTLLNTVIRNNRADFVWQTSENVAGGGAANRSATLTIVNSDIYNNVASSAGGGGVSNHNGTLNILNSRIHHNTGFSNLGGGIGIQTATNQGFPNTSIANTVIYDNQSSGLYDDRQYAAIVNSTISVNSDSGIVFRGNLDDVIDLRYVTIVGNGNAGLNDIGVHDHQYTMRGSIIANNTLPDGTPANCIEGRIVSEGYNLISDSESCYFAGPDLNSILGVDPLLGPLQDNGGGTLTHAPLPGSPTVDHIPSAACASIARDQRGIERPQVTGCDIGAFEMQGPSSFPLVHHVNTIVDTGDGRLEQDEAVDIDITTLQIVFSERMAGSGDGSASNPSNYILVAAGSDAVLQTSGCSNPSGADVLIPISQVAYHSDAYRTNLLVNNNQPLPPEQYRLFACGSIESVDGRQLDGNQDGTGGDDFARDFSVISEQPANFHVDSTVDAVDTNPGDGQCRTEANVCTLRAAIMEANALASPITIALPAGNYVFTLTGVEEDTSLSGDLDITGSVTLIGADAATTVIDANGLDRVFHVLEGTATFRQVTLQGGSDAGGGGGIFNDGGDVFVDNSIIRDNDDSGIANIGGSYAHIRYSVIADNLSGYGAGLFNGYESEMEINNSLVQGNTAGIDGGGIYNTSSILTVINTTITDNITLTESGGGIYSTDGVTTIRFSTIVGNHAERYGGGVSAGDTGDIVKLFATIVAGNTSNIVGKGNCGIISLQSQGYNLSDDTTSCRYVFTVPGDQYGVDVYLGELGDYGGPTQSYNILLGSPALDAVPLGECDLTADQRNILRPQGNGCDIGSFEAVPEVAPAAPNNLTVTNTTLSSVTLAWNDQSEDETAFVIERAPGGTTNWVEIETVAANINTYTDMTVECDTAYHYRVRAYRSLDGQYSVYSNTAEAASSACLAADLELGVIASTATPLQGEVFTYSLIVSNMGPAESGPVTINSALPESIQLVSAVPSEGSYNAALSQWTIGNLSASSSTDLSLTVRAGGGTLGQTIAYSVEIMADSAADPDSTPGNNNPSEDDWSQVEVMVGCPPASALNVADGDVIGLVVALDAANNGCFDYPVTIKLPQDSHYTLLQAYGLSWNGLPTITSEINIIGNNATIARDPGAQTPRFRIFDVSATGKVYIDNLNIASGDTRLNQPPHDIDQHGAGIRSAGQLTVHNSRFLNHYGYRGGAIFNNGGTLFVTDSTFTSNRSMTYGGAITSQGGTAATDIRSSTFITNTANRGGALANLSSTMTVTNSTFYENKTNYLSDILETEYGTVTLVHNTFQTTSTAVNNRFFFVSSAVMLKGNIINAPALEICDMIGGTVTSEGGNIIAGNNWCGSLLGSDQLNVNPLLGQLADNGGLTQTMSLLAGSPAIDAVALTICTEASDQRGMIRPQNEACDAGAFETYTFNSLPNAAPQTDYYTDNSPTLTWGQLTWAAGYHIQVDNNRNFSSPEYENTQLSADELAATSPALADGRYYWRVRARRENGTWGVWSGIGSFVVDTRIQ